MFKTTETYFHWNSGFFIPPFHYTFIWVFEPHQLFICEHSLCMNTYKCKTHKPWHLIFSSFWTVLEKIDLAFNIPSNCSPKYEQASLTHVCDSYSLALSASLFEKNPVYPIVSFFFFTLNHIKKMIPEITSHWWLMRLIVWGPSCFVLILRKTIISQSAVLKCCSIF